VKFEAAYFCPIKSLRPLTPGIGSPHAARIKNEVKTENFMHFNLSDDFGSDHLIH